MKECNLQTTFFQELHHFVIFSYREVLLNLVPFLGQFWAELISTSGLAVVVCKWAWRKDTVLDNDF